MSRSIPQSLWHTISLYIRRRDRILASVDTLKHIIRTRLSRDARVRCVSISCLPPWNDRRDKAYRWRPKRVDSDEVAWQPLAEAMAEMRPLSEVEWEDDKLPFCILQSLNTQHPGCRLRIVRVNCSRQDIDDQPARKLHFMYELLLQLQNEYVCRESLDMNEAGCRRTEIYELATVGNLSGSLTHLKHRDTYPSQRHCVRERTSSGYELIPRFSKNMIGSQARFRAAALSSLNLISQSSPRLKNKVRRSDIMMWSILTHLPALQTFKSKLKVHGGALKWLTAKGVLGSLKTLDVAIDYQSVSRHSCILVEFLRSLPPLDNLALTGEFRPTQCHEWISSHASSLKRMRLMMIKPIDSTFDTSSLSALLKPPLPLLEHLSITIERFRGNSSDVGMYEILGAMPRLQSIVLGLEVYSISPEHPERDSHLIDPDIADALVNSAVDEKLAIAIFCAISAAKSDRSLPLERLEVHPNGGYGWNNCHFRTYWAVVALDNTVHSWLVKRKFPGLGSDVLSIHQI